MKTLKHRGQEPAARAQTPAEPRRDDLVLIEVERSLRRKFGLKSAEIREIDIALALEYGLVDKPRKH